MREFIVGVLIVLAAVPLDAYGSHCRKRFVVRKQVVVKQVVQQVIQQPVYAAVYQAPPQIQVQAAALQPVYVAQQQQQAQVCCVPCCPPYGYPPQQPYPQQPYPPAGPPPQPVPGQPGDGNPPQPPPPADPGVPAGDASDQEIQALATRACIECHGDVAPKGGLSLTDVTSLAREQRLAMSVRVMLGEMPPSHPEAVSDAEAQALSKWSKRKVPVAP